jgi:hypothetical protein
MDGTLSFLGFRHVFLRRMVSYPGSIFARASGSPDLMASRKRWRFSRSNEPEDTPPGKLFR